MVKNSSKMPRGKEKQGKISMILEILGIMEERGISKDLILQEIRKLRIRGIRPAMTVPEILKNSPLHFILHILNLFKGSGPRPSVLPPTQNLHWFYTDVVASSNPKISLELNLKQVIYV